jgi:hypothetical protein
VVDQEAGFMDVNRDVMTESGADEAGEGLAQPGLDRAPHMQGAGAALAGEFEHRLGERTAAENEGKPESGKGSAEGGETVMEPPARGTAEPPAPRAGFVEHEDRKDGGSLPRRCEEGRLVIEAEIGSEKHESRAVIGHVLSFTPPPFISGPLPPPRRSPALFPQGGR